MQIRRKILNRVKVVFYISKYNNNNIIVHVLLDLRFKLEIINKINRIKAFQKGKNKMIEVLRDNQRNHNNGKFNLVHVFLPHDYCDLFEPVVMFSTMIFQIAHKMQLHYILAIFYKFNCYTS